MTSPLRSLLHAPLKTPIRFLSRRRTSKRSTSAFYKASVETLEARLALAGVEVRQFDFNTVDSPNQPGWVSVRRGDLFNLTAGYGWVSAPSGDTYDSRASGDDVVKDGHTGKSGKFQLLVNPGSGYNVELIFRDKRSHEFVVSLEGSTPSLIKLPKLTTITKPFANVISSDNILTIQFDALPREEFIINGLRITGEPVVRNSAPVANADTITLDEDSTATINVLANDVDANGDPITVTSLTQPLHGTVTNNSGNLTYTPNPDFFGNDPFNYTINDGKGGTSSAQVSVIVNGVNDRPIARDDAGSGFQTTVDTSLVTANVLNNDTDPDVGDVLQVIVLDTTQTLGTVTMNGNGTFDYSPPSGFVGTDVFRYTVGDPSGETASASVTIETVEVHSQTTHSGIWISAEEIMALPTTGQAWDTLFAAANSSTSAPDISNQDDNTDVLTLAKALVGVRLGDQNLITQVRTNILAAIGTEVGGRTLALGRNVASYVIAADLVGLSPQDDATFRAWLRTALTENLSGRTLQDTHEDRPNNWGTMAGGSRAAIAIYLGDTAELERTATVFKGYVGDRSAYANFNYGSDLSWQANPNAPVGINPKGATKEGHSIDGVLPDDMRRGGTFTWPPIKTGYPWEGLQGALVQAEILHRAGYDSWEWQDQALLRAVEYLYEIGWPAEGDDQWQPWLINARYGSNFAANPAAKHGKIIGWTSWTHQLIAPPLVEINTTATTSIQAPLLNLQTTTTADTQIDTSVTDASSQSSQDQVSLTAQSNTTVESTVGTNSSRGRSPSRSVGTKKLSLESATTALDEIFADWQ